MKVYVVGDSHGRALEEGLELLRQSDPGFGPEIVAGAIMSFPQTLAPFHEHDRGGVTFSDPAVSRKLRRLTGTRWVEADPDVAWVFALGFTTTHFVRSPTWFRYAPWPASRAHDRAPISSGAMRAMCTEYFGPTLRFYEDVVSTGARVLALEAPPPRRDDRVLEKGQRSDLLLELDGYARTFMRVALGNIGIAAVPPPAESIASDHPVGFLRDDLRIIRGGDRHHATAAYGALVLPSILEAAHGQSGLRAGLTDPPGTGVDVPARG